MNNQGLNAPLADSPVAFPPRKPVAFVVEQKDDDDVVSRRRRTVRRRKRRVWCEDDDAETAAQPWPPTAAVVAVDRGAPQVEGVAGEETLVDDSERDDGGE